jgi:hypothetical protein
MVAWHEVPGTKCLGKRPSKEPSRRARYDRVQLRIGAHTCTNHTVPLPYGTALWGGAAPGTSCQATITTSLRDISQYRPRLATLRPISRRSVIAVRCRNGRNLRGRKSNGPSSPAFCTSSRRPGLCNEAKQFLGRERRKSGVNRQ